MAKQVTSTITKKRYRTRAKSYVDSDALAQSEWSDQSTDDVWRYTTALCRAIKHKQTRRRYELAVYQNLYCNTGVFWAGSLFRAGSVSTIAPYHRLNANIIKSCVDTATARVGKDCPRVFCLPSSADSRLITKADKATKYLDGGFEAGGVYASNAEVFRDSGIYGDGLILFQEKRNQIVGTYVKIDEVFVDEIIGMYNDPHEIHWAHPTPYRELVDKYPAQKEAIDEARNSWKGELSFLSQSDLVLVTHSWRRRIGGDSKDKGRHVCVIEGVTLLDEDWDFDFLPILRWQWTTPTYGPFGLGIAQEIEGTQRAINELIRNIMRSHHLFAVPRVWVEKLSQVSVHQLQNGISVNQYTGSKPIFETPPAASADAYQFVQWLIDWSYKQLGLSQLTAQSEKPAGLNSGVGLRNYQDIETQRFAIVGQRWERFHVEEAKVFLALSRKLYERTGSLSVNTPGRAFIERIDWKDMDLATDQYELQAFPTSLLPRTPEGQLQSAQELINSGFMPKDVALGQLRIPNLNSWIEEQTASRDNINLCLSRIRDKGIYTAPNGIADINACVNMAANAWLRADLDPNMPTERTELLLRFLTESLEKQKAMTTPSPSVSTGPAPVVGQAPAPPPAPLAPAGSGPITTA